MAGDKQRKEGAVLANGCVWRDPHVAPIYKPFKQIRIMKEVHYIWIDFESSTGSSKSILLRNGCFSLDGAKKFIKSLRPKTLYENRPTFLKDCVKITLTAQNIVSSNTLYRRTINIVA